MTSLNETAIPRPRSYDRVLPTVPANTAVLQSQSQLR